MSNIKCDKKTCIGCLACVYACKDAHYNGDFVKTPSRRSYEEFKGAKETDVTNFRTKSCMHCKKAKCMEACPADAIYRDEYDFVQINLENCINCHACEEACPFNAIQFSEVSDMSIVADGAPLKCDGCVDRIKAGLEPACVSICPVDALSVAYTVEKQ